MHKHFQNLIFGVSVLPALLVMPAMADRLALNPGESVTESNKVYSGNSESWGGGVDVYQGTLTETNITVQGNSATYGGGIDNYSGIVTLNGGLIGGATAELGNHATTYGGGIYNVGSLTVNGTTLQNNVSANYGGGLDSQGSDSSFSITDATFSNNSATKDGGGIYAFGAPGALTGAMTITHTNFFNNSTANTAKGGAIAMMDAGDMTIKGSTFGGYDETDPENPISLGNTAGKGGAIYIGGADNPTHGDNTVTITKDEAGNKTIFDHNVANGVGAEGYGGALVHNGYKTFLDLNNAEFTNNSATNQAGALSINIIAGTQRADGLAAEINNVLFANNTSAGQGGALWNGAKVNIINTEFRNNSTIDSGEGGGAIDLGSSSKTVFDNVTFADNTSASDGGALTTRWMGTGNNFVATLDITGSTFAGNTAVTNGGAINNWFYHSATPGHTDAVYVANSTFEANSAENGGAIYNNIGKVGDKLKTNEIQTAESAASDIQIGSMYFSGNMFTDNTATTNGGAIYNEGEIVVANSQFYSNESGGAGGAIYQDHGTATISNSIFGAENRSNTNTGGGVDIGGGAIVNYSGEMAISNSDFLYNKSKGLKGGGAILNATADSMLTINGGSFANNSSKIVDSDKNPGGAIVNYGTLTINKSKFANNESNGASNYTTGGGAIYNSSGILNITGTGTEDFVGNCATGNYGGAVLMNGGVGTFTNVEFKGNSATRGGGAVYARRVADDDIVTITNSKFINNSTVSSGGAIHIVYDGIVVLNGDNTFTGNTANGVANDIHNLGTLNIASGTTKLDGGITGDGTLSIANGATLNIGKSTITQGTINLNGTLIAELVANNEDALFNAGTFNNLEDTGKLSLVFEKAGTYKLFSDAVFNKTQEQVTSTIFDLDWGTSEGKTVVATKKSVEAIASDNNIAKDTAFVVSHIADAAAQENVTQQMRELSLKLQEKLANQNIGAVEHATKAVHPETESVARSVFSSVQNTVVNMTSSRMAAPVIGRNGGDVKLTSGGVWAQGLLNRTKQDDSFSGHTRGIAFGLDGTLNKYWTVGAGYSFAHSDISGTVRDTDVDSNTVFLYGQYKPSDWYVNATLNYTMSDYSENGTVIDGAVVSADYDVDSFGGNVATGYNFKNGVTPEIGLRYMHISADDYLNSYGIKTHLDDTDFLTGIVGTKYAFSVLTDNHITFVPQLNVGIKYDFLSDRNVATVTMPGLDSYTLDGSRLKRIGGEFGIGLGMQYNALDVSLNYDIDIRKDYTSQTGMLKFRYNF